MEIQKTNLIELIRFEIKERDYTELSQGDLYWSPIPSLIKRLKEQPYTNEIHFFTIGPEKLKLHLATTRLINFYATAIY